ncbi:hypothetical protein CBR_g4757 [Chara braunii]|uniref:ACT domain-containing protein n=1 Tax=Chara braunii TaxID=69332 RepID=A0A388KIR6_CHABU|nr:hypothetical protein CBR_g4757 [Chara braunii]|eukprot:GBG69932.1 hypothetical protein CBR_g4757 [Chara braunii]
MPVAYIPRRPARRTSPTLMPAEGIEVVEVRRTKNGNGEWMGEKERAVDINCPNANGLACEIMRVIFEFGLSVTKGDLIADGFWCFVSLHVLARTESVKWLLLKQRLEASCPSPRRYLMPLQRLPLKGTHMHLLKVCTTDRSGLLNDVAHILWQLEFTIHRVNVSTCPDGQAVDLLFITDEREELPSAERANEVREQVLQELDPLTTVELSIAGPECGVFSSLDCSPASRMMPSVAEALFPDDFDGWKDKNSEQATVKIDNAMSDKQTMVEIDARDRRGLMYDCMRTLKDLKLKVAMGRIVTREKGWCNVVVFVQTPEESQVMSLEWQNEIIERLRREVLRPIRLDLVTKDTETELLIATPIEASSGKGRPRVLYDVTLALRCLKICIFKADITRHNVANKLWEVYRFVLTDLKGNPVAGASGEMVKERVKHVLMG